MRISTFRKLVVEPTLAWMEIHTNIPFNTTVAVDLLCATAAHESAGLRFLKQINNKGEPVGPALSFYQIEPNTFKDLRWNFLNSRPHFSRLFSLIGSPGLDYSENLLYNMAYATVAARLIYWRVAEALPVKTGPEQDYIEALARYWKKYWNTERGAGTVEVFVKDYANYIK